MWQTIQILLGPEEHSGFIREAVAEWDIRDRDTGELYPKILPRECFPLEPDKHMVAWYEGVSERLKREAEDEERRKEITVHEEVDVDPRRPHSRLPARRDDGPPDDDEESIDSRTPALAYFRDPLYRHVEPRPVALRKTSDRSNQGGRPTMMDKGKSAATTFGRVVRNVGSPHLWDGRGGSRSASRDRRRRSNPDSHHNRHFSGGEPPSAGSYESRSSTRDNVRHGRRASQVDGPDGASSASDEWDDNGKGSPPGSGTDANRPHRRIQPSGRDQALRHSRSHDPTPSQREGGDYFAGYEDYDRRRRSSAYDPGAAATPPGSGRVEPPPVGPSFGPSASPLFASHLAKQPQPPPQPLPRINQGGPPPQPRPPQQGLPPPDMYNDPSRPSGRIPSIRRTHDQDRYPSRSPDPYAQPRPNGDRRYNNSPRPDGPPLGGRHPPIADPRYQDSQPPGPAGPGRFPPDDRDPRYDRGRQNGGPSGSDVGGYYSGGGYHSGGDDGGRGGRSRSRPKQTRFADAPTGVGGRRYADESPWRRGS